MPAVLIHGVPETFEVWGPLRAELSRKDVHALQLPGFGCPRPSGFDATKETYVRWLIGQLEDLATEGPIDLVGHDWGGGFVVRLVSLRPDLVRSWVTDVANLADPGHEWHPTAKLWQTPEAGEEIMALTLAMSREELMRNYEGFGIPADSPGLTGLDLSMAECILALYRSAVDVGSEWAGEFRDVPRPGLVLLAGDDIFLPAAAARAAAKRSGARLLELPGINHFWPLQDPARAARILEEFWASAG
jgi:pimeloyl-ACP methyl ester carboxylesterase